MKGGSDAINTNIAIVKALKKALTDNLVSAAALALIESTDRETTNAFMKMDQYVDVLIPRGGAGLIQNVVKNATIPVIQTGTGNCHVYVDKDADFDMAVNIINLSLIHILKPALTQEALDKRLLREFEEAKNKQFKNSINKLLPAKMIPVIIELSGIDPDKNCLLYTSRCV